MGEFESALEMAARAYALGEAIGDVRIQSYALWNRGWYHAASGDGAAAIAACELSLERSLDPFTTAAATGWLGYAYLEAGQPELAVPWLEQALASWTEFEHGPMIGMFTGWLADADRRTGDQRGAQLAQCALELNRQVEFWWALGWAERVLGLRSSAATWIGHVSVSARHWRRIGRFIRGSRSRGRSWPSASWPATEATTRAPSGCWKRTRAVPGGWRSRARCAKRFWPRRRSTCRAARLARGPNRSAPSADPMSTPSAIAHVRTELIPEASSAPARNSVVVAVAACRTSGATRLPRVAEVGRSPVGAEAGSGRGLQAG
jgi:hypothetical protein